MRFNRIDIDLSKATVSSIVLDGIEIVSGDTPLFEIRLMDKNGEMYVTTAYDAQKCEITDFGAIYDGFPYDITVKVKTAECEDGCKLGIDVENRTDYLVEWVKFPCIPLAPLKENGGIGSVLSSYNEGVIIDNIDRRDRSFKHEEPEYPSKGSYWMFPYMVSSQFMAYLAGNGGLYMGAHDIERAPKGVEVVKSEGGVTMCFRLFIGNGFGKNAKVEYPLVLKGFSGTWHSGADIYRNWFENNLPAGTVKIKDNKNLPEWYKDSPLIVSYPVRGIHDMDEMKPNALFPYMNAMPTIKEIADKTGARLMVLLMHWEGSAPWAPPYVWPPYGGEDCFMEFMNALHGDGNLLGVYCSGFGYTLQSNLIAEYNMTRELEENNYADAMCVSPKGTVEISRICTGQRSGYDICAASEKGREILINAYSPLLKSGVDYAQILDQNHGGSQYFCYSRSHGHIPSPGAWMTKNMQSLLSEWNKIAGKMLLGCESAAAEAYIPNLLFSDNRYELNYHIGYPVPLYAYVYHEYLRNFMGNQVCCGLSHLRNGETIDTMRVRLGYSFVNGDSMTLVITPAGNLMANWGNHDFEHVPNKEKTLEFCKNMTAFYKESAGEFLHCARMIKPLNYTTDTLTYYRDGGDEIEIPAVYCAAYEKDGRKVQLFVNHTEEERKVHLIESDKDVFVPRLGAVCLDI